jgi:thioredoxin 1
MITTTSNALHVTDASFDQDVLSSDKPVLVDFTASWCGPCRMIAPIIEEMASEYAGKAVIAKVDVDECPNISINFGIRSVPTLMIFKGGKPVDHMVGAMPKQVLVQKLNAQLN